MKLADFDKAMRKVTFGNPFKSWEARVASIDETWWSPAVYILMKTPDRDTGRPEYLHSRCFVSPVEFKTEKDVFLAVRNQMILALTHEVDESILVEGERIFDPHKPSAKATKK